MPNDFPRLIAPAPVTLPPTGFPGPPRNRTAPPAEDLARTVRSPYPTERLRTLLRTWVQDAPPPDWITSCSGGLNDLTILVRMSVAYRLDRSQYRRTTR